MVHRDIKPENVFLTDSLDIKYGDFGISFVSHRYIVNARYEENTPNVAGTRLYMSPESFSEGLNLKQLQKSDVFALGITFFELWCAPKQVDRVNSIVQLKMDQYNSGSTDDVFSPLGQLQKRNPEMVFLIKKMTKQDPDERWDLL